MKIKTSRVILTAGGGGHTGYAYALAQELYGKVELVILVPKGDALTYERMKQFGTVIEMTKPRAPGDRSYVKFGIGLLRSLIESLRAIKPKDVVVSCGSNFAIFPLFAGFLFGCKTVNLETSVRFIKASKTPRILRRFATLTALQWEEQKALLPGGEVFGPILAKPLVEPKDMGYILVTGGTFGNKSLFDAVVKTSLKNVLIQMGPYYTEEWAFSIAAIKDGWTVIDYSTEFHKLIAGAKVVVTHFGETILEAALVYGKPVVICPNPDWTLTAGVPDAQIMAKKVNGIVLGANDLINLEDAVVNAKLPPVIEGGQKKLAKRIFLMATSRSSGKSSAA